MIGPKVVSVVENNVNPPEKDPRHVANEIFNISKTLLNVYKNEPLYHYPIDFLQYSHFYEVFQKMLLDISYDPLKTIKIQENFLSEYTRLCFSIFNHSLDRFHQFMVQPLEQLQNANPILQTWMQTKLENNGAVPSESKKPFTVVEPKDDRRFSDPIWDQDPYYRYLKQSYYLITHHALKWLRSMSTIDRKTRMQLHFYVKNFLDFLCPANFISTNPEVMQKIAATGGENILNGIKHLLIDLVENRGRLNISKTDLSAFKVGKNIAITPGKIVYQNDLMQLIQYLPTTKQVYNTPILFIPPWINKYYVLDLSPENSMVRWLVDQGFTVYMISWVNPTSKLSGKSFSDYMMEGPIQALEVITKMVQCPSVHMVGYCIGGTLLACTLAYMAKTQDNRAKSSTFFMSLLDFSNPGELGVFIDKGQLEMLDKLMCEKGYLDGRLLDLTFNLLRPNDLVWPYFINNYLLGKPLKSFDLLYWNADSSNLPYRMYSFYLHNMYLHNRLRKANKVILEGVPLDLGKITIPSLFLASKTDHITPWRSVYAGTQLVGGTPEFILTESGHVRGVINPPPLKKYNYYINSCPTLPHKPKEWLQDAKQCEGSWWPYWAKWLSDQDPEQVPARDPRQLVNTYGDAPGSYVLRKL